MKLLTILLSLLLTIPVFSQEEPEMADALRQDGKFWVVVLCLIIILFGLLSWIFLLDRKISKLEKEQKK